MKDKQVERFERITKELVELYARKNCDYGDAFRRVRKFIPGYAAGKLYDKVSRFAQLTGPASIEGPKVDESIEDTLRDLACYAIMELAAREEDHGDEIRQTQRPPRRTAGS